MIMIGVILLLAWIPIVLGIFMIYPPRRAVVSSFVVAWLFLPNLGFDLPGLPNYTKMTATVAGVLLAASIFDSGRFLRLRPRWFDAPILLWCICPLFSALMNNAGVYNGLAAVLEEFTFWGFSYLIGRAYFADLDGIHDLALGMVIGGLVYVPLCLIEIRLSPRLEEWVYGMAKFEGVRYGGFRPKVFLTNGLTLGLWMTCTTLLAQRMWACRSVKRLWGFPFGQLTLALSVTTLLCKSTGALILVIFGFGILWLVGKTGKSWPAWILIAIAPVYCVSRTTEWWSGRETLEFAKLFGADRAQSLEFRFQNEDDLIRRANVKPIFGWGKIDFMPRDKNGYLQNIIDGYWIIAMGNGGAVALTAFNSMLLLPLILLIRRQPVSTWNTPELAPAAALAVALALYMIDNLGNAMLNPIYALAMGGLTALRPARIGGRDQEARAHLGLAEGLAADGLSADAEPSFRRAIELSSVAGPGPDVLRVRADALAGLGACLMATGRLDEAEEVFREVVEIREALAVELRDAESLSDLALAREGLSRALSETAQYAQAIEERRQAIELWDVLLEHRPTDVEFQGRRVDALNDLAWLLVGDVYPEHQDPEWANRLAEEATRLSPDRGDFWNTLGAARYRLGDWAGAVEALERSAGSENPGGTAFDHYWLAMACRRLGDDQRARFWFGRAIEWNDRYRPGHPTLARLRDEAATLLGERGRPKTEA